MSALTLPRLVWGQPNAPRHALIVHGLGSSAQTCWRLGEALAGWGFLATAVDLRGHGYAPRGSRYRIQDFAEDLAGTTPAVAAPWDVVIGHSIGAASAVVAAQHHPDWTRKLVLLDPALTLGEERKKLVHQGQLDGHDRLTEADVARDNPHWHPLDIELRIWSAKTASRFALEHAVIDNPVWDVSEQAKSLTQETLVIGGDPEVDSMFTGDHAEDILRANPQMTHTVIAGAGHSPHRDQPEATLQALQGFVTALTD